MDGDKAVVVVYVGDRENDGDDAEAEEEKKNTTTTLVFIELVEQRGDDTRANWPARSSCWRSRAHLEDGRRPPASGEVSPNGWKWILKYLQNYH
jgi:hypothetical protein